MLTLSNVAEHNSSGPQNRQIHNPKYAHSSYYDSTGIEMHYVLWVIVIHTLTV